MAAIKYWVWLSALQMPPRTKQTLLEHFHNDPERLFFSTDAELRSVEGLKAGDLSCLRERRLDTAMEILGRCEGEHIGIVTMQDAAYPQRLKHIYDPPAVLYVKRRLPNLDEEAAIAVVGTRGATPYGIKMARRFGRDLARCGAVVISGLTRGIDRTAAEGALYGSGKVVGVLGTGHDEAKGGIYDDVLSKGALISEYPPGLRTYKSNFNYRNRITSGLSVGVLVVEAPHDSGAVRFAHQALDQGKEVFALPGNVDADNCAGTNQLLKEGARPVTKAWDVLCEYQGLYPDRLCHALEDGWDYPVARTTEEATDYSDFVQVRVPNPKKVIDKPKTVEYIDLEKQLEGLSEVQLKIVAAIPNDHIHIDDLIDATGLDAAAVLAELTMLQIDGIVSQQPGKRFSLNIMKR